MAMECNGINWEIKCSIGVAVFDSHVRWVYLLEASALVLCSCLGHDAGRLWDQCLGKCCCYIAWFERSTKELAVVGLWLGSRHLGPLFIVLGIGNSSHVCFGPIIVQRSRGRIDGNSFFFLVGFFFLSLEASLLAYIYYRSLR